jgi:hypothetical protein
MGQFDQVHTSKKFRLLTRKKDAAGNEYIYLKGVGSTAATDFVQVKSDGSTARMTTTTFGPIAVAMAAVDATTKFGWYMIWGVTTGHVAAAATGNPLFASGTTGEATNSAANDTALYGAFAAGAAASNAASVLLSYPTANGNITV